MKFTTNLRRNKWIIKHKNKFKKMVSPLLVFDILRAMIGKKSEISYDQAQYLIKEAYPNITEKDMIFECTYKYEPSIDLSIIIPVYNSEKYLYRCIESVLNQKTKYNFEVILINDGSTDESQKIIEYFKKDTRIIAIQQDNHGISFSRNRGITESRGEYVSFLDNDDYISENYIEELLNYAYLYDSEYVKCGYEKFNKEGHICDVIIEESDKYKYKTVLYDGFIWGGVIKRSIFNNIRFPIGYWYEDIITKLIIMRISTNFKYLAAPLYHYNVHSNNASVVVWKSKNIKCLDQYFLVEKLCEISDKLNLKHNEEFYSLLLHELGEILWERTKDLNISLREAVFVLSSKLFLRYNINLKKDIRCGDKLLLKAFSHKNFKMWMAISKWRRFLGC